MGRMNQLPAIVIKDPGLDLEPIGRYPAGKLFAGGFDATLNTLFLAMPGHPQGMSAAGGNPSKPKLAGITMFRHEDGRIFWANDSPTMSAKLSDLELELIQQAFVEKYKAEVLFLDRIGDVQSYI